MVSELAWKMGITHSARHSEPNSTNRSHLLANSAKKYEFVQHWLETGCEMWKDIFLRIFKETKRHVVAPTTMLEHATLMQPDVSGRHVRKTPARPARNAAAKHNLDPFSCVQVKSKSKELHLLPCQFGVIQWF